MSGTTEASPLKYLKYGLLAVIFYTALAAIIVKRGFYGWKVHIIDAKD